MKNKFGIIRVACASPEIKPGNPENNAREIVRLAKEAEAKGAGIVCFPELSLCGKTIGDLLFQRHIYNAVLTGLKFIKDASKGMSIAILVGTPIFTDNKLFNCACLIHKGELVNLIPSLSKDGMFVPFTKELTLLDIIDENTFIGNHVFNDVVNDICIGVQVGRSDSLYTNACCDLAEKGAQIIFKMNSIPAFYGEMQKEKTLSLADSIHTVSAICNVSAGPFESVTDELYSGYSFIACNGNMLSENKALSLESSIIYADIDTHVLNYQRRRKNIFSPENPESKANYLNKVQIEPLDTLDFDALKALDSNTDSLISIYNDTPFIPKAENVLAEKCASIFSVQGTALARRISQINSKTLVIGISGGLDSTLALLVCTEAIKILKRNPKDILAVTMPGFGTSDKTYDNSLRLMDLLGVTYKEINITDAVNLHFKMIEHDPEVLDVTYENAQARERTQILMDLANKTSGIVVGTGDLSEAALGWCTYNGDHMSMYSVNSTVPKTLIPHILRWYMAEKLNGDNINSKNDKALCNILESVIKTPISPELLPKSGSPEEFSQKTEDKIGPYELHDFFIHSTLEYGLEPEKLLTLSSILFKDRYSEDTIKKWLKIFYKRFFTQQFKRNCAPDGIRTDVVSFSPREGFKIASDIDFSVWTSIFE